MHSKTLFAGLFAIASFGTVSCAPEGERGASKSFAGSNLYFLHALPKAEQKTYVTTLAGHGVKVLRLWVTGLKAGCQKGSNLNAIPQLETTVGQYDTTVLKALDDTLKLLHENNIKAIISPHNANALGGGSAECDAYCKKYGAAANFYSSAAAKADYDARIRTILNFKSPNFGNKPWKDLREVIWAIDLQNEPLITNPEKAAANDPDDWVCGRAGEMRKELGTSNILVATGGIAGSHYCCDHEFNLIEKALRCDALDILSVHSYMSKASDWAYFITGAKSVLRTANQAKKLVMVEEWGVAVGNQDNFEKQVKVFNDAGIPWLYWQFVPGKDGSQSGAPANCGYDSYEIGLNSPKGNIGDAVRAANRATANQTWVL